MLTINNHMGNLFIVATPIGNLKDISIRALEVLKSVDYVLCEDTRVTGKLLAYFDIDKQMVTLNDFNESSKIPKVIDDLKIGKTIALVSDAGSPLISDPGYKIVREAIKNGIDIDPIPGPSAPIAALSVSGLPPDKFLFIGYLPKKQEKRKNLLQSLFSILQAMKNGGLKASVIIFETPHRLLGTLQDLYKVFGDSDVAICREMTKLHQEIRREKISQALVHFSKNAPRGELTILL